MKIEEHNKLSKLNGKLITLDVQIIQIYFQIWSRQMYKIVKIQFKTVGVKTWGFCVGLKALFTNNNASEEEKTLGKAP